MRAVVVLSLLCFTCLLQRSFAEFIISDDFINKLVPIVIMYIEMALQKMGTINIIKNYASVNFTDMNQTNIIAGTASCSKLYLYGFDGFQVSNKSQSFNWNSDNRNLIFALNISITKEVGLRIDNYTSDVGIVSYIPVYGQGNLTLSTHSVKFFIMADMSFEDSFHINYLDLRPEFSASKITVTRFWNNDELSNVISGILTGLLDLLVVVWDAEADGFSCVISSLIESLVNKSEDVWKDLFDRCKGHFVSSEYSLLRSAFNGNQFVENISKSDVIRYIETAADYLTTRIESHM